MPARAPFRFLLPVLLASVWACGDDPVTRPAPHAGSPAAVATVAGEGQLGVPGAALAVPLTVQVTDSAGHPVEGVSVTWRAGEDAGTLDADSVRTGADGRASARWTLGSYIGEWTATATVGDLPPIVFHGTAGGPIHVRILSPVAGASYGATVPIQVEVPHESDVAEVSIIDPGGYEYPLSLGSGGRWSRSLVFQEGPFGPRTVSVTARDVAGNAARAYVTYVHDLPIQIRVLEPLAPIVAGQVAVRATCTDDNAGGCRSLQVFTRVRGVETRLAQGADSVSATWPTGGLQGQPLQLVFRASNAVGDTAALVRDYSAAPAPWQLLFSVPGTLSDASPERALYVGEGIDSDFLFLRDFVSGQSFARGESNIHAGIPGWVTAAGAIVNFGVSFGTKPQGVQEWGGSGGSGQGGGSQPLARGRWASWLGQRFRDCVLFRDDVLAPALAQVDATLLVDSYDLADDGTIAFSAGTTNSGFCLSPGAQLYVWRPGTAPLQVTSDSGGAVRRPATDGSVFLYLREVGTASGLAHRLYFRGAAGEEALTPDLPAASAFQPTIEARRDYQVMNGWAAFQYPDASGAFHTFVRTPAGDVHAVWPGAPAGTRFVSLGPDGQVLLRAGDELYLSDAPHAAAVSLGIWSDLGHVKWIGGKMHIVRGSGFYRLDRP